MTMKGESFKEPKRVTGFTVTAEPGCAYTGPDPLTLPIQKATDGKGIAIKRNKDNELHFSWNYNDKKTGIAYELQGVQRPDPEKWIGLVSAFFKKPPGVDCSSAYEAHWKAVFVGLI